MSNTPMLAKLAASTMVLGLTMVGCKPAADASRPRSAAQVGTQPERLAGRAIEAARAAAGRQDYVEAVKQSEAAVTLVPHDAGYRATLAEMYLKSGRFDSAAAAYRDALTLNPGDSRARLSLALTEIGLGENAKALATLGSVDGRIAAADLGLALALAGDKEGAIRLLSTAAREDGASGRVRQNLALAYALAGDWTQARTIAAQDVPADEIDARMASWATFAAPRQSYDQVATLLGVVPTADAGQPTRLALNAVEPEAVQVAAADVAAPTSAIASSSVDIALNDIPESPSDDAIAIAVAEEPVVAPAYAAAPAPTPTPTVADAPAYAAALASVAAVLPRQMARPVARTIRAAASAPTSLKGRYVVQIGAFASADRVERAWNGAIGRFDRLGDYAPASTRFASGRGTLTRLSVGGFRTRGPATDLCDSLRRAGGSCFVRMTAGDAPVRWASRAARNGRAG